MFQAFAHDEAVHDHIDIVLELLVEGRHVFDFVELAIHLNPLETALLQLSKFLAILAFPTADHWSHQVEAGAFAHAHNPVDHLTDGLALDGQACCGGIGDPDSRPKQTHVVVDFCDRADRGARVLGRRLLFDGDCRGEAFNQVDVWLLHHLQELAGIGGEALHIAPLAVRIDRVEGERGLSRAA